MSDVSHCEEQKIKLFINADIKISRNLSSNFRNAGSNVSAFQLAIFQHSMSTIGGVMGEALLPSRVFANTLGYENIGDWG